MTDVSSQLEHATARYWETSTEVLQDEIWVKCTVQQMYIIATLTQLSWNIKTTTEGQQKLYIALKQHIKEQVLSFCKY